MSGGDSVLCRLVKAADEDGRIEFSAFSDLKTRLAYPGSARRLRDEVEALYQGPATERRVHFKSRKRRSLDFDDDGNKKKILILVPACEVILHKLQDMGPISVSLDEIHADAFDLIFDLRGSQGIVKRLLDDGRIKATRTGGSKGKVYETLSLA